MPRLKWIGFLFLISLGLYVSACSPTGESCGDGTKWDEAAKKCIIASVLNCSDDTVEKDGKCVPKQEVCADDKVYDSKAGKCVDPKELCGDKSEYDAKTGTCVTKLECSDDTVEKDGKCVTKIQCGGDTEPKDGKCVPKKEVCGDNTKLDTATGKCVPTLKCGAGTEEKGGKCVQVSGICGEGTKPDGKGNCIVSEKVCEKGTQLDVNTKKCVPSDKVCGKGSVFTDGKCVPSEKACAWGTKYDETTKQCLPDYCKHGDKIENGKCITLASELLKNKDADEKENNDPTLDGAPQSITLKKAGDTYVLAGTIDPPKDLNNDGKEDQDIDVFSFQAKANQWVKITVQSIGLPSPAFVVRGMPEKDSGGNIKDYKYMRFTSLASSTAPTRYIYIPEDGTYEVIVLPNNMLAFDISPRDGVGPFQIAPQGDSSWKYVLGIGVVDGKPQQIDGTKPFNIKGDFTKPTETSFELTNVKADQLFHLIEEVLGKQGTFLMYIWDGTKAMDATTLSSYPSTKSISVPASGKLTIIFDWQSAYGTDTSFEYNGRFAGYRKEVDLKASDKGSAKLTFSHVGVAQFYFDAPNKNKITIEENGNKVAEKDDMRQGTYNSLYFLIGKAGDYTFNLENKDPKDAKVTITILLHKTVDLGSQKGVGDKITNDYKGPISKKEKFYWVLNLKENVTLSGTFESNNEEKDVDLTLKDKDFKTLKTYSTSAAPVTIENLPLRAGTYIFELSSGIVADLKKGVKTTLELKTGPVFETEPNNTDATATSWDHTKLISASITKDDVDYFKFTLAKDMGADEVLELKIVAPSASYKCSVAAAASPTTDIVGRDTGNGCFHLLAGLKTGDYLVKFEYSGVSTTIKQYTVTMKTLSGRLESESNNDLASASATEFKKTTYGLIGDVKDIDLFEIKSVGTPATGEHLAVILISPYGNYTSSTYKMAVEIQDENGTPLANGGSNEPVYVHSSKLKAGAKLYAKIYYPGTSFPTYTKYDYYYHFTTSFEKVDIQEESTTAHDSFATAQQIKTSGILTGEVKKGETDYFKFTLAADMGDDGLVIDIDKVGTGTGATRNVVISDSKEKEIASKKVYSSGRLFVRGLKKGDYYLSIENASSLTTYNGKYKFTFHTISATEKTGNDWKMTVQTGKYYLFKWKRPNGGKTNEQTTFKQGTDGSSSSYSLYCYIYAGPNELGSVSSSGKTVDAISEDTFYFFCYNSSATGDGKFKMKVEVSAIPELDLKTPTHNLDLKKGKKVILKWNNATDLNDGIANITIERGTGTGLTSLFKIEIVDDGGNTYLTKTTSSTSFPVATSILFPRKGTYFIKVENTSSSLDGKLVITSSTTKAKAHKGTKESGEIKVGGGALWKYTLANDVAAGKSLNFEVDRPTTTGTTGTIYFIVYDSTFAEVLASPKSYTLPKSKGILDAKKGDYYIFVSRTSTTTSLKGSYTLEITEK